MKKKLFVFYRSFRYKITCSKRSWHNGRLYFLTNILFLTATLPIFQIIRQYTHPFISGEAYAWQRPSFLCHGGIPSASMAFRNTSVMHGQLISIYLADAADMQAY